MEYMTGTYVYDENAPKFSESDIAKKLDMTLSEYRKYKKLRKKQELEDVKHLINLGSYDDLTEILEKEEKSKKRGRPKKPSNLKRKVLKGKEYQIMDAVSFAHKEGDRALITTNMNVSNGLSAGDKRTLKKSIQLAIKDKLGGGLYI